MALVDSLLTAMVRADGDALVMHVGERPIVIAGAKTIDLSSHGLNLSAMVGMLGQLLSPDAHAALREFGAVEHALPSLGDDRFSVVAARGGDDIWIEIRRRRDDASEAPVSTPAGSPDGEAEVPEPVPVAAALPVETAGPAAPEPVEAPDLESADAAPGETVAEPVLAAEAESAEQAAEPPAASHTPAAVEEAPAVVEEAPAVVEEPVVATEPAAVGSPESAEPAFAQATALPPEAVPERTLEAEPESEPAPALESDAEPVPEFAAAAEPASVAIDQNRVVEVNAPADEAVAEEQETEDAEIEEAHPVPAMASAQVTEHAVTELRTPMSYSETTPQSGPPAGGPPPSFVPPSPAADTPAGTSPEVTRTVRIEVPSRANPARAARIDQLLHAAMAHDVSELFLVSQSRPYIRADGDIRVVADESPLQPADVEALVADLTPEPWRDAVRRGEPAEWLIELPGVGRVRCTTFRDQRGPGAMFRFAAPGVPTAEQMGLGPEAVLLATEPEGLVLVASPAGSDRSAVVAAFVDTINQRRSDYIITVEPQVHALHQNQHALVSQREVGHDASRALAAARAALRESPDVLVLEDVASPELATLALEVARDERLVIVSLEAPSAATAVQRFVDLLPEEGRQAGRTALAQVFRGALAQLVVRKAAGGRVSAREQLSASRDVSALIAGTDTADLAAALDTRADAATPIVDVLSGYVREGAVDVREAFRKAPDPARLLAKLREAGVDTGAVERLA